MPTDRELAEQAEAHLRKTTISYPDWKRRVDTGKYNPKDGSTTEWGKAFAALDQIDVGPPVEPPPSSTDFFVSPAGNDAANGSAASPWRTLRKACSTVTAGTIHVATGTYAETGTCVLADGVSLIGAGSAATILRCSSSSVSPLLRVQNTTRPQTISDLRLDGQAKTTAAYGLWAENTVGLTITRVDARGFVGSSDHSGGGINILGATDLVLSHSTLSGSGGDHGSYCTANLGLGTLLRADIHHLTITAQAGMCIQRSNAGFTVSQDVDIHDCTFVAETNTCALWSTLAVEFWWTAINCTFRNNYLNKILSIPEGGTNGDPGGGRYRWRIHHNHFDVPASASNQYSIELGIDYTEVDHNYIHSYLYPLGHFHPGDVQDHITVHHNVFDFAKGQTAMWHDVEQVTSASIYKNTVVLREPGSTYTDGVLCFGEAKGYPNNSTGSFTDNLVCAVQPVGDKLGKGIGAFTISGNAFYNITPRGSGAVTANPNLPLAGGFPVAYVPSGTPATKGAFADGQFSVGPT